MASPWNALQVNEQGAGSGEKLRKKRKRESSTLLQTVEEVRASSDADSRLERKKKKELDLDTLQMVEKIGSGDVESQVQRKKEKKREPTPLVAVEEAPTSNGADMQVMRKKEKKEKKRDSIPLGTFEDAGTSSGTEVEGKRKKEKKKKIDSIPLETVEDAGTSSGTEVEGKRKKEKKKKIDSIPLETVEDAGTSSGTGVEGKRKKEKKKKIDSIPLETVEDAGISSGAELEGKRKKEKRKRDSTHLVNTPSQTVEEVGTGSDAEVQGTKKKEKKKKRRSTPSVTVEDVDEAGILSNGEPQRKKRKKEKNLSTSQTVEECGHGTGTAKKTNIRTHEVQTGNGNESVGRKKKNVTFQLPDSTQDDPSENEVLGEEAETNQTFTDELSSPWKNDRLRTDLTWGIYTPEEDGTLKRAVFDYIREQGWDQEDGVQKILNSKHNEARGCWHTIRKCLPQREIKRLYARAHRLLDPGNYLGKWTSEETESLIELQSVHGNDWKRISNIIGRDASNCKDKWRSVKFCGLNGQKRGPWLKEEQQKLCALVLKSLHVKKKMTEKGQVQIDHRMIRDDINWEFIAGKVDGRNRVDCMTHWYRRMASPMVTTGEWSNGDDQRLLERLMEEFPLSEELVEWDSLVEHRSGETCKRRWEQMQRSLGREPAVRHLHFIERLENVVARFAPHLVDAELDEQFASELQEANADESEDDVDA